VVKISDIVLLVHCGRSATRLNSPRYFIAKTQNLYRHVSS